MSGLFQAPDFTSRNRSNIVQSYCLVRKEGAGGGGLVFMESPPWLHIQSRMSFIVIF